MTNFVDVIFLMWNIANMGDNIRDAALKGITALVARKGWAALVEQARERGVLKSDHGSTCMSLFGSKVLIDRTAGFSEDEFHRAHREYSRYGITDIWVISASASVSAGFMERYGDRCLRMVNPHRSNACFVLNGRRYTLNGGLDYVLTGSVNDSAMIPVQPHGVSPVAPVKHRNALKKVTLLSETVLA